MSAILILTNCSKIENAKLIARTLVANRLAACVNISAPITSIYNWNNNLEEISEYMLLIKTMRIKYTEVEQTIQSMHDYEIPEIITLDITNGSSEYLKWIQDETNKICI